MKYLNWKPNYSEDIVLKDAYLDMKSFVIAESSDIPLIIQLFENPKYDFLRFGRLKGSIDLFGHDVLHILLKQDMSLMGEAYVIGFTMGSTKKIKNIDIKIFEFASKYLYPKSYKFNSNHITRFKEALNDGYNSSAVNLHRIDYRSKVNLPINQIRQESKLEI